MVRFWSQSSSVCAITAWLFLVLVAGPRSLSAIPLASFYPYGTAAGDNTLPRNDDGASPQINISIPFNFFARSPTSLYVRLPSVIAIPMAACQLMYNCLIRKFTISLSVAHALNVKHTRKAWVQDI